MPNPRSTQVSLAATPYYHCVSRCVRRAFLCGRDYLTGRSFEHRRGWIEERILSLSQIFAMDVCAYAVMSNHFHVVLHVNVRRAESWSEKEVVERWHRLFKGTCFSQRFISGEFLSRAEQSVLQKNIAIWRERLQDLSWYMRCLNEPIAREANKEDDCTGRFWEGRFKSQALLDERALLACMAYVDLNPVRAKIADTPESSEYTSIKRRIVTARENSYTRSDRLLPFVGNPREPMPEGLPFCFEDYLNLVDWTGRQVREDKRGAISSQMPPILSRIGIEPEHWYLIATQFESRFKVFAGSYPKVRSVLSLFNKRWAHGQRTCKQLASAHYTS